MTVVSEEEYQSYETELKRLRDYFEAVGKVFDVAMKQCEGKPHELENQILIADKLETLALKTKQKLLERLEIRFLLEGQSKTGAKKKVIRVMEIVRRI